ncbi:hypothetical protein CEY04_21505 [Achromobacter sp. HZ28]|nr:hypothetical protein CEY05_22680 [Achromobacter sp. HZ34]OWT73937.1 hypothetical protein CEY04_21505 [Achromobacter sp. HZ28]
MRRSRRCPRSMHSCGSALRSRRTSSIPSRSWSSWPLATRPCLKGKGEPMTLLKRLLNLREAREKRDAQSVRHARHARAQADEEVATAERILEQGLLDARREGDALFDGMRGQLWSLSAVQGMHGKLESLRQGAEALRAGVAEAEEQRQASQEQLEATQAVHRRSQKQVGKTKEMHTVQEREMAAQRERKEDLEMEEIGSLRASSRGSLRGSPRRFTI